MDYSPSKHSADSSIGLKNLRSWVGMLAQNDYRESYEHKSQFAVKIKNTEVVRVSSSSVNKYVRI